MVRRHATLSRTTPAQLLLMVILLMLAFFMVIPFVWMVSTSFRLPADSFSLPPQWIPRQFVLENYWQVFELVPLLPFAGNSVKIATIITGGQLLTSAMAAYAFARLDFRGKHILFLLLMSSLMVPHQVTIVPVFVVIRSLGLNDTHWALILPGLVSAFGIFLLRQFFLTLPPDLEDAAKIDGANPLQIFTWVILPLSVPALSVLAIFTFNASWNDFFRPLIFLTTWDKFTLPLGLVTLRGVEGTGSISVVLAGVTLATLPVLLIFLLAQRYLIEGITMTGLKG